MKYACFLYVFIFSFSALCMPPAPEEELSLAYLPSSPGELDSVVKII